MPARSADRAAAVWAGNAGLVIELARLAGPHSGRIDAPPHLLPSPAGCDLRLEDPAVKARLYEACLTCGSPYDVYRYVNLDDLADLFTTLPLPAGIAAGWTHALRDLGLLPDPPQPTARPDLTRGRSTAAGHETPALQRNQHRRRARSQRSTHTSPGPGQR